MDMYQKYTSPFGYQTGTGGIDTYGVNHNGFSLRDEIEYQFVRQKRENELQAQYNAQGITENYPQYTTNFWGNSDNNYGFGMTNITDNIANMKNTTTTIPVATATPRQQTSNNPNCYVEFDGNNVDLYKYGQYNGNKLQNGQLQGNLNGQSGDDYHQSSAYQNVANHGPIPEGTYWADQNQRQNIGLLDAVLGGITKVFNLPYGTWKGSIPAWGTKRVWLRPDANTNTYGRSGFSIHGGLSKGSAGCIDIPWQTGKLSNYLDNCQDSVPVYVKYPKGW